MRGDESQGVRPAGGVNPYSLRNTMVHPLARMTPKGLYQQQVYRLGEKNPPVGAMADHSPKWEVVTVVLDALGTTQARINVERDFHIVSLLASSSSNVSGGFRAQLYDTLKKVKFEDRGVNFANLAGASGKAYMLREPYQFDLPNSQVLLLLQNLEAVQNTIQIVLYGQVLRFNQ